jgi:hypothetical protein
VLSLFPPFFILLSPPSSPAVSYSFLGPGVLKTSCGGGGPVGDRGRSSSPSLSCAWTFSLSRIFIYFIIISFGRGWWACWRWTPAGGCCRFVKGVSCVRGQPQWGGLLGPAVSLSCPAPRERWTLASPLSLSLATVRWMPVWCAVCDRDRVQFQVLWWCCCFRAGTNYTSEIFFKSNPKDMQIISQCRPQM